MTDLPSDLSQKFFTQKRLALALGLMPLLLGTEVSFAQQDGVSVHRLCCRPQCQRTRQAVTSALRDSHAPGPRALRWPPAGHARQAA